MSQSHYKRCALCVRCAFALARLFAPHAICHSPPGLETLGAPRARGGQRWRPDSSRQLILLELEEVDMAADKGPKRVRVDRADESSTQV
eukprot:scaffold12828_cov112-Isochrysis_galbana.AAC.1